MSILCIFYALCCIVFCSFFLVIVVDSVAAIVAVVPLLPAAGCCTPNCLHFGLTTKNFAFITRTFRCCCLKSQTNTGTTKSFKIFSQKSQMSTREEWEGGGRDECCTDTCRANENPYGIYIYNTTRVEISLSGCWLQMMLCCLPAASTVTAVSLRHISLRGNSVANNCCHTRYTHTHTESACSCS